MSGEIWPNMAIDVWEGQAAIDFADRLRAAMRGKSVADLGRASGVPDRSIRQYLKGTQPSVLPALKLAHALDVNLNWLLAGVGSPDDPMNLAELKKDGFDPSSKDWTFLYVRRFPASAEPEEAVPVRREWLEKAGLSGVAGLWLTYMPAGEGREGDAPDLARPGDMIVCRNALGLEKKRFYLFEHEGLLRAGFFHEQDGVKLLMPGRLGTEIAVADDIIMIGEIRGKLGISEVK